jgi:hypothetical protein
VNPEWLQSAEAAFHAALPLDPPLRAHVLQERCGHDPGLKAFVERLLASYEGHPSFALGSSAHPQGTEHEEIAWPPGALVQERFRIQRLIGSGATGSVYEARDERLPRTVALKVLRRGAQFAASTRRRFEQEAHALSQLRHDHIASIIDFVSESAPAERVAIGSRPARSLPGKWWSWRASSSKRSRRRTRRESSTAT